MNSKTDELLHNEEFLKKVLVMEPEEAQKEFAAEGSDITIDELKSLAAEINANLSTAGEFDETMLDNVSGGCKSSTVKFAIGVAVGIAIVCAPW